MDTFDIRLSLRLRNMKVEAKVIHHTEKEAIDLLKQHAGEMYCKKMKRHSLPLHFWSATDTRAFVEEPEVFDHEPKVYSCQLVFY